MLTLAVVGLGALGGPTAARLKSKTPHTVYGVTHRSESADHYRTNGLVVHWLGTKKMPVFLDAVYHQATALPNDLDYIIVATKADALAELLPVLQPKLKSSGAILTYQNGYVLDEVLQFVPPQQVVAASVVWAATLKEDGSFDVTGGDNFRLGGLPETPQHHIARLKELLEHLFPVETSGNIRGTLWSKMCVNCCVTTVGAITGLRFGEQTRIKAVRKLFLANIAEIIHVGEAHGISFEPLNGQLHPRKLSDLSSWPPGFVKHAILKRIGSRYKDSQSSMLQSLQRGRRPEIDHLNGLIVRLGQEHGIETPINRRLVDLIQEILDEKRPIGPENLPAVLGQ